MKKLKFFPPSSFFSFFLYLFFVIIDAPHDSFVSIDFCVVNVIMKKKL
jgi:hypothetical protein